MIQYRKTGFLIIKKGKRWLAKISRNFGKWLIYSQNPNFLTRFAKKLNILVEEGKIQQVKFVNVKKLSKFRENPLPKRKESFLCIYCWKKDKSSVKHLLKEIGLDPQEWKSNLQTVLDWLPQGKLYKEMKRDYPKEKLKKKIKEFVNIKYWKVIKRALRKNLSEKKFCKIREQFLKVLFDTK